jgi:hypothetical protein
MWMVFYPHLDLLGTGPTWNSDAAITIPRGAAILNAMDSHPSMLGLAFCRAPMPRPPLWRLPRSHQQVRGRPCLGQGRCNTHYVVHLSRSCFFNHRPESVPSYNSTSSIVLRLNVRAHVRRRPKVPPPLRRRRAQLLPLSQSYYWPPPCNDHAPGADTSTHPWLRGERPPQCRPLSSPPYSLGEPPLSSAAVERITVSLLKLPLRSRHTRKMAKAPEKNGIPAVPVRSITKSVTKPPPGRRLVGRC